jgi:glucose/arabinose dehydrogenase
LRQNVGGLSIRIVFFLLFVFLHAGDAYAQLTNPPSLALTQLLGGFVQPVHITHAGDGSGRMFIVEQPGRIQVIRDGVVLQAPFLDISASSPEPLARRVLSGGEQGLLSLAFPPGFAAKNYFYVYYTNLNGNNVVARYSLASNPDAANPLSEQIILVLEHPTFGNHNGGQIAFGPDGFLYIAPGDGGGGACDTFNNAQNPLSLLGKMLRVDVESPVVPPATYNVPAANPFSGTPGFRPEIWALGLRNPFRFSFDRLSGDLYIGDVGQAVLEEVNVALVPRLGGENYGWNIMEGTQCSAVTSCPGIPCDQAGLTLPVAEYDHTLGCSVTGGFVYRGADYPRMQGIYFYGDFCSGRIWGLEQEGGAVFQNQLLLDSPYSISTFGEDQSGGLFLADYATGSILIIIDQIFADVPFDFWAHQYINAIFNSGITVGCGSGIYCPDAGITRAQMAVFIEKSLGVATPPPCTGTVFGDVTAATVGPSFCGYIERLAEDGITAGCGGSNFCPFDPITRAQMAVFIETSLGVATPPPCTGTVFGDVTAATVGPSFCGYIERLAEDGITAGCGGGNFCPFDPVSRAQMAVFIVVAPTPLLP